MLGGLLLWAGLSVAPGLLSDGGSESSRTGETEVYHGVFRPLGTARVRGEVTVRRAGERLSVRVRAHGLPRGEIGQQIHAGESCADLGPISVHLDGTIGAIESGAGGPYPSVPREGGRLVYDGEGVNPAFGGLDLAQSSVVLREGAPGLPIGCAELFAANRSAPGTR